MLFVPLGANLTPMACGAEEPLPQPDKPRVRRAISPESNTATVARFTIPPDRREDFSRSRQLGSCFSEGVTTSYSSTLWCPILDLCPVCEPSLLLRHGHFCTASRTKLGRWTLA